MKLLPENIKLKIWGLVYGSIYGYRYWKCRKSRKKFNILDSRETVEHIVKNKLSVSRFGDGELAMIYHYCDGGDASNFYIKAFQDFRPKLAKKLYEVLINKKGLRNHIVGIPYPINSVDEYKGIEKIFWKRFVILDIKRFLKILPTGTTYANACFTRFYLNHSRRFDVSRYVGLLKQIWNEKNICIVEGENSRLGIGNDLFANAKSIGRILCPAINAFDRYDAIVSEVKKHSEYDLYILALGHTATILASDLSELGLWAIDLGHIDIEYEWFLRQTDRKIAIPNKYVNEIPEGRIISQCNDEEYLSQIIAKV